MRVRLTGLVGVDSEDRTMKSFDSFKEEMRPLELSRFVSFEISFGEDSEV